jgi:3-hydroxybutyryl-CoA dehydrogenase
MKQGTNYPYGPLEWADRIGLDEIYAITRGLQRDLAEERYRTAPLLRKLVLANRVGVRSGQGFYTYDAKGGCGV